MEDLNGFFRNMSHSNDTMPLKTDPASLIMSNRIAAIAAGDKLFRLQRYLKENTPFYKSECDVELLAGKILEIDIENVPELETFNVVQCFSEARKTFEAEMRRIGDSPILASHKIIFDAERMSIESLKRHQDGQFITIFSLLTAILSNLLIKDLFKYWSETLFPTIFGIVNPSQALSYALIMATLVYLMYFIAQNIRAFVENSTVRFPLFH